MKHFKILMLGAFGVGKSSLTKRFVDDIFDERYQTTLGVKIDSKSISLEGQEVLFHIWDLAGVDDFNYKTPRAYIRGSHGYLLVADGLREKTIDVASDIQEDIENENGSVPFVLLINKMDLIPQWEIDKKRIEEMIEKGWLVLHTSALTGAGVEEAFTTLARMMI